MPIKPEPVPNLPQTLKTGGVVRLSGPDALAFAQAQFANDVTLLHDGQWQWNLWLSAKGRVIALFALLRLDAEELLLWLPDHPGNGLVERLTRFRFRSKVEIAALPQSRRAGAFVAPEALGHDAHGHRAAIERDADGHWTRIVLDLGASAPRCLHIDALADAEPMPDPTAQARWLLADIAHGLPRLAPAQIEAYTPQMLGLERLAAFSTRKGCYPGQEIVARTHFLGQAKRGIRRLGLDRALAIGSTLRDIDGNEATILALACDEARHEALAIAPVEACGPFRSADGEGVATVLPLLDGLAR